MCTRGGRQSSMWGAGAGLPHAAVVLHERECVWCRQTASVMCGQKASSALFRHGSVRVALSGQLCAGSSVGGVAASHSGRSPGHPAVARLLLGAHGCLGVVSAYRRPGKALALCPSAGLRP